MKRKGIWFGMLVIVLAFGMTVIACDNGTTSGVADPGLNGTWASGYYEITFDNGNFAVSYDGTPDHKGPYTTNNGKLTINITDVWGENFLWLDPTRWYSISDFKSKSVPSHMSIDEFNADFNYELTSDYSISGNTLTMDGEIFIKQ